MSRAVRYFYQGQPVTLFDCHKQEKFSGVLYISHRLIEQKKFLKRLSLLTLIISLVGLVSLILPIAFALLHPTFSNQINTLEKTISKRSPSNLIEVPVVEASEQIIPVSNEFRITIPKIGLVSDIVPNVDTTSEEIYKQKLKYGVAHANGSYLPGQNGMVFLFAHSTDSIARMLEYNAKFMDIYKLEIGDGVQINYQGKLYQYNIINKIIINPNDLELIRQANSDLVLSTCWPLGTNWQRLILFADQI